jgi:glutathione S-transferase
MKELRMADLTLFTNPMSRGRIARWMLEELGEPYDTRIVNYGPEMKSPEYRAINPMGKVPALRHGNEIVTEGAAICAYVADAFPDKGLAPEPGSAGRASYYRWLFFCAGPVEQAVTNTNLGVVVPEERERMVGYGSKKLVLDTLEGFLENREFITGKFSAADVYVGAQVIWGLQFGTFDSRPAFEAYAAGLRERPAYKRATEIDEKLTAEIQAKG